MTMTKSELEILFKMHYAAMFRLAVSLLYDADEARDVVSDGINVIRHKQMRERFIKLYATNAAPLADGSDDSMMLAELREFIDNHLSPLSRRIFTLRYLQDMTCQQVADAVGVSRVTVHHHLSQSLEKINAYFNNSKQ